VGILTGQQRDNQNRLSPLGVESKLGLQVLPVLAEDVKRGYLTAILRKIRNGLTPFARDIEFNISTNLRSRYRISSYKICKTAHFVNTAD